MDYYLNDAGLLVCETTIAQTRFDINGHERSPRASARRCSTPTASTRRWRSSRRRTTACTPTNGCWPTSRPTRSPCSSWARDKSKLYRSSKNEWFGGTEGFYWGCNNTKDLDVRLETIPGVNGEPANMVFRPSDRDKIWLQLFQQAQGQDRRRLRQAGVHDAAARRLSLASMPSSRRRTWPRS